jgi:hypothetical protein
MPNEKIVDGRDPVQQYHLRRSRRRWAACGLLVLLLLAVGYWYVYLL